MKLFLFSLLFLITFFSIGVRSSWAQGNFSSGNTTTLQKEQIVNEDYFTTGGTVVVSGTVNGDVYVAGGNILINGTVNGDVLAAGGNVTVNGTVKGNVRVVGGQLVVGGTVEKNVSMAGGNITIEEPAKIGGSLTAAGGAISLLAPIGKGVTMGGNQLVLDNAIGGDVNVVAQKLDVSKNAKIAGTLNYWSSTKTTIPNGAVVKGVTYHHTAPAKSEEKKATPIIAGFNIIWEIISLMSAFVIGLLLIWLAPLYMKNISLTITTRLAQNLGIGFVAIILLPFVFIVLLLTIVGIPLAFIMLGAFLMFIFLNKIFISYAIGKKILPQKTVLALLLGLFIYGFIRMIPVIGGIWSFGALCIGLGAFMSMKKSIYTQLKAKKLI